MDKIWLLQYGLRVGANLCYLLKGNYNISDVPIEGLTSSNKNNSNSLTNIT